MDVYEALYTTRAMRRVKPDPVPADVQRRILDAAIRAPTGGNAQSWRFLLVDAPEVKGRLGPIYRACLEQLFDNVYKAQIEAAEADPTKPASVEFRKMVRSARYLAQNFEKCPLLLFAFSKFDSSGGSIFPAVWSAMLAARAEGVGSALTSLLALRSDETQEVLGVPETEDWQMVCCVTMGYPTGRWDVAPRKPADSVAFRNQWGGNLELEIPEPLWPADRA